MKCQSKEIRIETRLAYGDLSDVQTVEKTAEEIRASKLRKYSRVTEIQKNLKNCLEDYVAGLAFYNCLYTSGYVFSCKFNDSILTSEEAERKRDREDVAMGVMSLVEYSWLDAENRIIQDIVRRIHKNSKITSTADTII